MRSNPNPNWEDLIREPNSETEFHIVEKIQDAFDTREYGNRGPCFRLHFALNHQIKIPLRVIDPKDFLFEVIFTIQGYHPERHKSIL